MEVKIDTKEKFTVVTPMMPSISDNIAADLANTCMAYLQNDVKNIILNLESVSSFEVKAAERIASLQQQFQSHHASFVLCCLWPTVAGLFEKTGLSETLNITPTESEAWDIVQMEEIERELLREDDISFEAND
jgi:anti-anti-sigma factor